MNGIPATILLVGFPFRPAGLECLAASDEAEALALLAERSIAILGLGEGLKGERALRFLDQALAIPSLVERPRIVVLAGGDRLDLFSGLVHGDDLFYLARRPLPEADLVLLLESAAESWRERRRGPAIDLGERRRQILREATGRLDLQQDLASAGELAGMILRELAGADRSSCLLFDPLEDVLWSGSGGSRRRESPAVGLVSFVVRTGRPVILDSIEMDPRWDRGADDPKGSGGERFLAVPVRGADARIAAVLAAVRGPELPPFDDVDVAAAARLAVFAGPVFGRLAIHAWLDEEEAALADLWRGEASPFRPEALEEHAAGLLGRGEALRLSPAWIRWGFLLVVALALAGLLILAVESWK